MARKRTPKLRGGPRKPRVLKPPAEIIRIVELVSADDRRWFEEHPTDQLRIRSAVPGEFWPILNSDSVSHVQVFQVQPGFRLRKPVVRINLPESDRVQ